MALHSIGNGRRRDSFPDQGGIPPFKVSERRIRQHVGLFSCGTGLHFDLSAIPAQVNRGGFYCRLD